MGLDVHASQTACAVFDSETGEVFTRRFMGRPHEVMSWLGELPAPVRAVYEAGPTGYGLARRGRAAGIDVRVCAPGMIARSATGRVKTDKRDAIKLARLHAAGQLVMVHVPTFEHEQLRDLARCREDARQDLMRAKHRVGKFLLRREVYSPGRGEHGLASTARGWRRCGSLTARARRRSRTTCTPTTRSPPDATGWIARSTSSCATRCWAATIAPAALPARHRHARRVRVLRGDRRLGSLPRPAALSVPRPRPVREQHRRHAPAWARSRRPARAWPPTARRSGLALPPPSRGSAAGCCAAKTAPARVVICSWHASSACSRWQRLDAERGKRHGIVAIAVARELAASAGRPRRRLTRPAPRRSSRGAATASAPTRETSATVL